MSALLVFDDVIHGTSDVYTSSRHNLALGELEVYTIHVVVEPIPSTDMSTFTLQVETGSDGRNWVEKNPTAEINAVSMTEGATRTASASDLGARQSGAMARLRIALGGGPATPAAHAQVFVSGRRAPKIVPAKFPDCEMWLRADMGIELESAANRVVSSWRDMTMRGHTCTQSTSSRRPSVRTNAINDLPSVYFDASSAGTEKYFSLSTSLSGLTAAHAFLVAKNIAATAPSAARSGLWRLGGSASASAFTATDGQIYDDFGSNTRYTEGSPAATVTNAFCYEVRATSSAWNSYLNGTAQSSSGSNTVAWSGTPELGGNSASGVYYDGHVAEVIVYKRVLEAYERRALVDYLNARYALGMT